MIHDHHDGSGRGPRGFGRHGRSRRGPGGGPRASRGDARAAILALLREQPMHGYQVMDELAERSQGAWQPSPGSIYPALRHLAHQGLVTSREEDGRRIFELTEAGRAAAAETDQDVPPWERLAASRGNVDLRQTLFSVAAAAKQVASSGTDAQISAADEILVEARKRLYQLLAE